MIKLLQLIAALTAVTCVISFPTGFERWKTPCGNTLFNVSSNTPLNEKPLVEIINEMMIRLLESQTYANRLKNMYAIERIRSSSMLSLLEAYPLDGYSAVKELSAEELNNAVENVTNVHIQYYRSLSIHLVFIEQMRFDEEIYEENKYKEEIDDLERKLFDVLCIMTEALSNDDVIIDHVSRDVMSMNIRTLSERFDRFTRDYVTVKETSRLIENMAVIYTTIKEHIKTS